MQVLKYLDILIGLAVVMVLLSPVVSAITQLWLWLFSTRAGRLQVGIKQLLLQLGSNPYEIFDKAVVAGAGPTLKAAGFADDAGTQAAGNTEYADNIPGRLRKGNGNLTFFPALPVGTVVSLQAGTRTGDWKLTTPPTDPNGITKVAYNYAGPSDLASRSATTIVPAGSTIRITIASGPYCGTPLNVSVGPLPTLSYPANIRPVPPLHDLEIELRNAAGAPLSNERVTFVFNRNTALDRQIPPPLPPATMLSAAQAEEIARAVLVHPMVVQPPFWGKLRFEIQSFLNKMRIPVPVTPPEQSTRRGEVVEREELIRILLEFAAGEGGGGRGLSPSTLAALRQVTAANGIPNPAAALAGIRQLAQQLEANEPQLATHVRMTKAIVGAAPSSLVGKINNWFDQTMDRTTAEYKFRAQIVTVAGALVVALVIQMDSLELLKRLSTDGSLRASLVDRARDEEKRIDAQVASPNQNADELALAQARRQEIENNLAALRDPQLAVLPDHLVWDTTPQARLMDNQWVHPYSRRLELVLGSSVFPLEPQWSSEPLADIRAAIQSSGAPVRTEVDNHKHLTITGSNSVISTVRLCVAGAGQRDCRGRTDLITHINGFAQAALTPGASVPQSATLLVGNDNPIDVVTPVGGNWTNSILKTNAAVAVLPGAPPTLKATRSDIRWIELRTRAVDPGSNLLGPTYFVDGKGLLDDMAFPDRPDKDKNGCILEIQGHSLPVKCDVDSISMALGSPTFGLPLGSIKGAFSLLNHLVVTSSRAGDLQLRAVPGKPDTNMFNRHQELVMDWRNRFGESWRGLLLTWVLLSLGAPFWYDALKDLLKLRSTVAQKEEKARTDRQTENQPTTT